MHDKNGKPLSIGDIVTITGKITSLGETGNKYCNCTVECLEPMPAYPDSKQSFSSLNTKMVEKVGP